MAISFDYTIERDEGDRHVQFRPKQIPNKLETVTLIEGPNSSGKSTVLHLIAAAFYGANLKNLDDGLRAKVKSLIASDHQTATFTVDIESPDGQLKLSARKPDASNPEIIVEELKNGGKRRKLAPDTFEREYRLIYDIPDDPTRRMVQLLDEVDAVGRTYSGPVLALRRRVEEITADIQNSRNPKRIAELKVLLDSQKADLENYSQRKAFAAELVEKLGRLRAIKWLDETSVELEKVETLRRATKRSIKREVKVRSAASADFEKLRSELSDKCGRLDEIHSSLSAVYDGLTRKKDKNKVDAWRRISFVQVVSTYELDPNLVPLSTDLRDRINEARSDPAYGKDLERAKVYDEMQKALHRFASFTETLPGTDKTVRDLLDALAAENKKHQQSLRFATSFEEAINNLQSMHELLKEVKGLLPKVRAAHKTLAAAGDSQELEEDSEAVEKLAARKAALEKQLEDASALCIKSGIDLDDLEEAADALESDDAIEAFRSLTVQQLLEAINDHAADRDAAATKVSNLTRTVYHTEQEYERLNKKAPHPYESRIAELDAIKKACQRIEVSLESKFPQYGKALRKLAPLPNDPPAKAYAEAIGKYIASRIGKVRHVDGVYDVAHVDLLAGVLITREKRRIHLADMGTGQSMSAYLLALLSADDRRPVIALFDEVAMMDESSLQPVLTRMTEMRDQGKLLAGLVVQRADTVSVRAL